MRVRVRLLAFAVLIVPCLLQADIAHAQGAAACGQYTTAVASGAGTGVPVVPEALLADWKTAVGCLVPIISAMKDSMKTASLDTPTRARFLATTGALRRIATRIATAEEANANAPPEKKVANLDTIAMFQAEFRKAAPTIEPYIVLTFGARSDNYDMRLNAILILGNVIDEQYACVPLIQVLDSDLDTADYGVNGRANLLGMLSKVAPFVYSEDFANIHNVKAAIARTVQADDPKLKQTAAILANIELRLAAQTDASNRAVGLRAKPKAECVKYLAAYPPNAQMKALIKY